MRKLLLGSAAIVMGLALAAPAHADGVELDLGGHFKGYGVWSDQDTTVNLDHRDFDMLRETEIHFTGEYTLDNGLTVGAHIEAETDVGDGFTEDESYAYFSGSWGRINVGGEDGAAYLLQVAAPSADSNLDGIRQFVNPVNYGLTSLAGTNLAGALNGGGLDYDNDLTGDANKITYLSPVFNGFQAGVSYTFDVATGGATFAGGLDALGSGFLGSNSLGGVSADDVASSYGSAYEGAARYEGQWNELGFAVGGGFTKVELEQDAAGTTFDDWSEWNVGVDFDWGAFGLGVIYTESNNGQDTLDDDSTWVVGADYTSGAFKYGVSYLNNQSNMDAAAAAVGGAAAALGAGGDVDTDRWTGGVIYTYGPGMTFRGSLSWVQHDIGAGVADADATSILVGTQIDF